MITDFNLYSIANYHSQHAELIQLQIVSGKCAFILKLPSYRTIFSTLGGGGAIFFLKKLHNKKNFIITTLRLLVILHTNHFPPYKSLLQLLWLYFYMHMPIKKILNHRLVLTIIYIYALILINKVY